MMPVVDLRPVQAGQLQLVASCFSLDNLRVIPVAQQDLRWAPWLDSLQGRWLASSTQRVLCLEIQLIPVFNQSRSKNLTLWRLWGVFPCRQRIILCSGVIILVAP